MDKLKPCPFCGHEDASFLPPTCTQRDDYDSGDRAFQLLRCMGCYLDFPGLDWDFSGQSAARMWNTRAKSPELTAANARIAELEKALDKTTKTIEWLCTHDNCGGMNCCPIHKGYGFSEDCGPCIILRNAAALLEKKR